MRIVFRGKDNVKITERKVGANRPFLPEKKFFGLDNIRAQHERVKKILNRRSVVTDVD